MVDADPEVAHASSGSALYLLDGGLSQALIDARLCYMRQYKRAAATLCCAEAASAPARTTAAAG